MEKKAKRIISITLALLIAVSFAAGPGSTAYAAKNIFKQLPEEFNFSSGVGAWSTGFTLKSDGTFKGQYHDSDMGDIGAKYPNGTVYICDFNGKFSTPKKVSQYVYSMKLKYLKTKVTPGKEYYKDGIRYKYSDPNGFENADQFFIYLPGCPLSKIPEGFLFWSHISTEIRKTLPSSYYGIYNAGGEQGFVGLDDNSFWSYTYEYSYGNCSSELWPSYYNKSRLEFWRESEDAAIYLKFNWSKDNQKKFTATDEEGSGLYDISLKFSKNNKSVKVTVKSRDGKDLTPWGGTSDGKLTAKYVLKKWE